MTRLRVLLIAEAANPEWVSVPLVGWSHARALMELVDGHLATQVRNQDAIGRTDLPREKVTFIDSERVAGPLYALASRLRGGAGKGWTMMTAFSSLSYYYFEHLVWRQFGDRIRSGEFDIVHRLTPLSPTAPSRLATKCRRAGVPFILGPLNGGVPWPREFDQARRREQEWLSYVRGAYRLLPGFTATRRDAAAIIVGSMATMEQMPDRFKSKCVYIPENAIDQSRFTLRRAGPIRVPLRVAFVGRFVPYKCADVLLEAAAPHVREGRLELDLIGDGPERPKLELLREQLRLSPSRVRMDGWVPHERLQERLVEADLFAFPSIREFGGGVVLEAMALGIAPVVVAYGGPAELVTDETGWRVPISGRHELIQRFRETLGSICESPEQANSRGAAAAAYVSRRFTWPAKARQTLDVYRSVLPCRAPNA